MQENDRVRLEHILDAISDIESFTKEIDRERFVQDKLIRSAVVRQFEVVGEAAGNISENIQKEFQQIPWRIIKDFRNFLIHAYFGVDYHEVFTVIETDLPILKIKIENIINL